MEALVRMALNDAAAGDKPHLWIAGGKRLKLSDMAFAYKWPETVVQVAGFTRQRIPR